MQSADPSGLVLLEHINVNVREWGPTQRFYEVLGCQQAQVRIHMNCGPHTQFHMPVENPVQIWRGDITIAYTPDGLAMARSQLATFAASLEGRGVDVREGSAGIAIKSPWGAFLLRPASQPELSMFALPSSRPNTEVTTANGVVGIVEISLKVTPGTAHNIAGFYEEVFGFDVESAKDEAIIVGGPVRGSQCIRFQESEATEPYIGDHMCIYIGDFEGVFERCRERGLLYVNPRFTFLDDSMTLEQARHFQAFRIMDTKHRGDTMFTEEHEIRSRQHKFLSLPHGAAL